MAKSEVKGTGKYMKLELIFSLLVDPDELYILNVGANKISKTCGATL